tara:strand:+ start:1274 stop:1564 length:291 start_codon:yes stop_codon:yes gene_type:complete
MTKSTNKLLNGKIVALTDEEIKQRNEEETAFLKELPAIQLEELRQERSRLLLKTDWWASSDLTMTDAQKKYRQDLRDITKTYKSLDDVKWPTEPTS